MVFPERSRTMAHTTRETVNTLARKQLHLNHVGPERPKKGGNLYIEQENHKLDQIVARKIKMSLDKRMACFGPSKANSWRLERISYNRNEPFRNTSEATKKVERPTRERLMYKCHEP